MTSSSSKLMISGAWGPKDDDSVSASSVSLIGSGIVLDGGSVMSTQSGLDYSDDSSSVASASNRRRHHQHKPIESAPSSMLFIQGNDDHSFASSSEESSLFLCDKYFSEDHTNPSLLPVTSDTCSLVSSIAGMNEVSFEDGVYEDHASTSSEERSLKNAVDNLLFTDPPTLAYHLATPSASSLTTTSTSSSPSKDMTLEDSKSHERSLEELLMETPPRRRSLAKKFVGIWPSRKRLEQQYTVVDATKATQVHYPNFLTDKLNTPSPRPRARSTRSLEETKTEVDFLSPGLQKLRDKMDLFEEDGLGERAAADDVIRELKLGDHGWRAIDQLEEQLEETTVNPLEIVSKKMPSVTVAGITIPDYDAYVRNSVTKFCREELRLNGNEILQCHQYLFGI